MGFYHIEVEERENIRWLNLRNCGVVIVKKGSLTIVELKSNLAGIFGKDWP